MKNPINPVIADFMKQYRKDLGSYGLLCTAAEKRLRSLLEQKGIMAIVSARVKDPDRLEGKLLKRDAERIAAGQLPFRNADDIFDDIHDLVGARVALYFPGDAEWVEELLSPQFIRIGKKTYPPKAEHYAEMVRTGYTAHKRRIYEGYDARRFDGYCATHHYVRFTDRPVASLPDVIIEIQVASVLMHTWSEVEHDLAYKKLMGAVSREEYECLDELNGLVMAGEIILNRLNQLSQQRIQSIAAFESHYALAAYLSHWQKAKGHGTRPLGNVELLYESYRRRDVLTAEYLLKQLTKLEKQHWEEDQEPLADQLLELFSNRRNRALVGKLVSQAVTDLSEPAAGTASEEQINEFQHRWNNLEDHVKKTLLKLGHTPDSRTTKLMMVEMDHSLTKEFADEFNRLRAIRGQLVYGYLAPSGQNMQTLLADIDRLTDFLRREYGA